MTEASAEDDPAASGPGPDLDARELVPPPPLSVKEIGRLLLRTWPHLKPVAWHVVGWFSLAMVIGLIVGYVTITGVDLLTNAVLNAQAIAPLQQLVLILDPSYVEAAELTADQRTTILVRLILYGVAFTILIRMLADALGVVYWETWIAQAINQNLRVKMIENAEHLSLRYQSHARTGDAIYRVFQDSRMISNVISTIILDPLEQGAAMLGAFVIIWFFSPVLGTIFTVASVPIFLVVVWWTPRIQRLSWLSRQSNSDVTSRIQEVAASIRVLKANQAEDLAVARFDRDSRAALDYAYYLRLEIMLLLIVITTIAAVTLIAADYLMADWTVAGDPTFLGGVFAFILTFTIWNFGAFEAARENNEELIGKYNFLFVTWVRAIDMAMGLNRAFYLLDLKPGVAEREDAVPMPAPIDEIRYEGVSFAYDADVPVLTDVNMTARPGTITAIVGATGAGKSTLMSLLLRLYDPDAGSIRINGTPLDDLTIDSIRANTAIALQQNVLFATTVAENISYATPGITREDIRRAAEVACADAFIAEMADGYDTELGERGGKLSTGQRQRLSIARALVRNTPILILDEPTASLDAETEHEVLANLADWGRNRVVFVITHRLSTIRSADQIAFLKDGRVTEVGTHEELMAEIDGDYRRFVAEEVRSTPA
ncbi:MAG: ABC transporter ATP-binding protein [Gammaproteobacteria bacterium]|nr:ABC transporter ATP-binding protein [Gammaproteobacteria bacterium]MDE0442211.1 ABC transporter ATP-binding protein [Gammaproteobacteria bacterium]